MKSTKKIAVYTSGNEDHNSKIINFVRKGKDLYITKEECIRLSDGCYCNRDYFERNGFTIITYEEFVRDYLNQSIYYEIY